MERRSPSPEEIARAVEYLRRELEGPALARAVANEKPARRHQAKRGLRASWPNHEGLIGYARARTTRTHVGIYDGEEAGLDTDGGRYTTICEEHGRLVSHATIALARQHAPHPEEWCEVCSGVEAENAKLAGGALPQQDGNLEP